MKISADEAVARVCALILGTPIKRPVPTDKGWWDQNEPEQPKEDTE